ncbi:ABC transporter permease [Brevibacillus sp. SYP-B805]|uniref:ABC transporter permease n=1 Tax=Brevibacillus sp. SYP-B805 TaxID=1578199 RepID=UPI0013EBAD93|nr:ABC-2 family transporter protein [Brevibacillus sp. SYP-B805]NGQ93882.1 ABC transporter permease [Brevibacillus sp. SYP-B805]
MVYWEIIRKSYRQNLQYRLSHLISNGASAIFGLIYIAIWFGVMSGKEGTSPYAMREMGHYLTFTQCTLWITTFLTPGLGISNSVRTGAVSFDLMRPVNYFLYVISHEIGRIAYNLLHRSVPIGITLSLLVGLALPANPATFVWTLLSLALAVYLGLLLFYLVGISSFWTTEIRWAHQTIVAMMLGLGGQMIPVNLLPDMLGKIAAALPFACILYDPAAIYMEKIPPTAIGLQAGWALVLTAAALTVTRLARQKVEIQGG